MSRTSQIADTQELKLVKPNLELKGNALKAFFIVVIAIGIFFRFFNINHKVYWHDEVLTSLRTFGHTASEVTEEMFTGQLTTVGALSEYQHPSPDKDLFDTLYALKGNAEHPPLYYLMARAWAVAFGSSVAAMRSLPALTSLLALPCMYWLCLELFGSSLISWLGMTLVAISPFHILYAQEAREYSLWIVTTLLSSAAFLRAHRLKTKGSWRTYAVTVALLLYSHAMAILICIAHGLYLLLNKGVRKAKTLKSYLWASIWGFIAFFPWFVAIVITITAIYKTTAGSRRPISFSRLIDWWFLNSNRIFLDHELATFNIIFVVFIIYVLWFICRRTPRPIWSFILISSGVTALTLMVPDIFFGGKRSSIIRYIVPCIIAIQMSVAYFLAVQLSSPRRWQQNLGRFLMALIVTTGIVGSTISARADIWWTKSVKRSGHYDDIAAILNQAEDPLLISDGKRIEMLALTRHLDSDLPLQLVAEIDSPEVPDNFQNLFLLGPSLNLKERMESDEGYTFEPLHEHDDEVKLWKVNRPAER
ncbi:MAG: glycosyltransferase family 39 protein [Leptolyngbyaceae cyanobacterium]